ncbi:MAG: hypothetical protein IKO06_05850 [Alphaproteobacteria bacterium]|nr:hypothetical protein [Alphaproteobacteria bacterium]
MREDILKAVAQPPKILWAPMIPAIINLGVQFPMMFIGIGIADVNPLFFVTLIIMSHVALVFAGLKEPHLSTMMQGYGQTYMKTINLYAVQGNKFEP